jgi:signal transduction histidine kinase
MSSQVLSTQELDRLLELYPAWMDPSNKSTGAALIQILASIDRDALAQMMTEEHFSKGTIVFHEGEPGHSMYLIWAGQVAIIKGNLHEPTILGYRGPGEIIGEMALLEDEPRSASVIALESLRLLRISRENFQHWIGATPAIGVTVMASLSSRLREADIVRDANAWSERQLVQQVTDLEIERRHLLELQRVREETSNLIVHDLRNPLGTIYGVLSMLEMVLPEDVKAENRELLTLANSASARMQRLVDSLLDVAKLETGEVVLKFAEADLLSLLKEAGQREGLAITTQKIHLTYNFPDDLPPVFMDADKIDRVIANLLDNALKYTPAGGSIAIEVAVDSDFVAVSITDSGPGIPKAERERIFERFAQVAGQESPVRRGFGLGLTFCRLAIEAHGGQIWVQAGPNDHGSQFVFTLPLNPAQNRG